jgi:asparagine synthase (glutamine-hydrolysing)
MADQRDVMDGQLKGLGETTSRYAPDGTFVRVRANVGMGFQPYYTHERSKLEMQPLVDGRENMLCFDGRLDNYVELQNALGLPRRNVTDSEIVLAAFAQWGEDCFARFIGDWALALWSRAERAIYLARDHAGTRTLYYEVANERILWSTYLETFFVDSARRDLNEEFVARYLACQPMRNLTPYEGIRGVPPAHYVRIEGDNITHKSHWSWMAKDHIHYQTDAEYEEHFFSLFERAVERRTGPGSPMLAQLSGGMDSSSIVCMSDHIRKQKGAAPEEMLDTVSYFDESEPNWNERPYFEAVERQRGKKGLHLPLPLLSEQIAGAPVRYLWPGADSATFDNERRLIESTASTDYRVVLSGIGGDELLGGVPTPLPELGDLLATGRLFPYLKRAVDWCLVDRTPLLHMTGQTLQFISQQYRKPRIEKQSLPSWITSSLRKRLEQSDRDRSDGASSFPASPSQIANARTGPAVLETLPHRPQRHLHRYEVRYPYLDRDLDDFLLRVPRARLLGPGRRRALMRNALQGIVPREVLERRRKGTRSRSVLITLQHREQEIRQLFKTSSPRIAGLVDSHCLEENVVAAIRRSDQNEMPSIIRAIHFHLWFGAHHSLLNEGPLAPIG